MRKFTAFAVMLVLGCAMTVGCGSSSSSEDTDENPTGKSAAELAQTSTFGSMENVCHEAKGTNKANSDRGVTADSVRITTISDAGSSLQPGLNQELWDAATVFTRWCNDHGGINGRKITMTKGNAQLTQYKQTVEQACKTEFALVGGGGAFDDTGQQARIDCKLVAFPGFMASPQARSAPLAYPALANALPQRTDGTQTYIRVKYGWNQRIAAVYGNFDTTEFTFDQQMAIFKNLGKPYVANVAAPVASSDSPVNAKDLQTYPPTGMADASKYAKGVEDSQAQGMLFSGQIPDMAKLLNKLAADNAQDLKWVVTEPNQYDQSLIKEARSGLSRFPVYTQLYIVPFEAAGQGQDSLALDEYLELFKKYLPEGKSRAMLGVSGFASWLLFAQAANACGTDLTRKCMVDNVKKYTDFDAGGLIAPRDASDPTAVSKCFVVMRATPDGFKMIRDEHFEPSEGMGVFMCGNQFVFHYDRTKEPMKKWFDSQQWSPADNKALEASLP